MLSHSGLLAASAAAQAGPWPNTSVAGDVHYLISAEADETVVAFSGTHLANPLDWLRDFDFWPGWVMGIGLVHSGFGFGALDAWLRIEDALPPGKLVSFTGHSLGAALAACAAVLCVGCKPALSFRVVTFGPPRAPFFNPAFATALKRAAEATMYARRGDIVPYLPWRPYHHGAKLTLIGQSLGFDPLLNHKITSYAADLKALGF